jgi:radical SAM-linked protein
MTDQPQPQAQQQPSAPQRLRIVFGKLGSQKYIGHLDLAKTWERILRRAQISLAYSQGFNARPKMQLAAALPLGITSDCEIIDVWLEHPIPLEGLADHLMAVSPPGLPVYQIYPVPVKSPSLQTLLESAIYTMTSLEPVDVEALRKRVDDLLAQPTLLRSRRDKPYDLRPLIKSITVDDEGQLRVELALGEQSTGRPDELVDALGFPPNSVAVHRAQIKLRAE